MILQPVIKITIYFSSTSKQTALWKRDILYRSGKHLGEIKVGESAGKVSWAASAAQGTAQRCSLGKFLGFPCTAAPQKKHLRGPSSRIPDRGNNHRKCRELQLRQRAPSHAQPCFALIFLQANPELESIPQRKQCQEGQSTQGAPERKALFGASIDQVN